jgi:hypothetical protein
MLIPITRPTRTDTLTTALPVALCSGGGSAVPEEVTVGMARRTRCNTSSHPGKKSAA